MSTNSTKPGESSVVLGTGTFYKTAAPNTVSGPVFVKANWREVDAGTNFLPQEVKLSGGLMTGGVGSSTESLNNFIFNINFSADVK